MAYLDLALQQIIPARFSQVSSYIAARFRRRATSGVRLNTAFHIILRTSSIWTERYLQGGLTAVLIVLVAHAVLGGHRATDGLVPAWDRLRRLVG